MNQEALVLKDIERCKKVQHIMYQLGIEHDGGLMQNATSGEILYTKEFHKLVSVPTYRQDKLALALPDWLFYPYRDELERIMRSLGRAYLEELKSEHEDLSEELIADRASMGDSRARDFIHAFKSSIGVMAPKAHNISELSKRLSMRGQPQLEATADLLILLEEEGLLKGEKE